MGRRSTKENKNIYQLSREEATLTREVAPEALGFISADRIEKIENEKSMAHPDEILAMAECYKKPTLCNYYCSHECPIGQEHVPEIQMKDLSQITLEVLATLNTLDKEKNRFIEITVDGIISADELNDFIRINEHLSQISTTVSSLQLWIQQAMLENKIATLEKTE